MWRLLLCLLLVASPSTAQTEQRTRPPAPYEVAEAMVPCLADGATWEIRAFESQFGSLGGIVESNSLTMQVERQSRDPDLWRMPWSFQLDEPEDRPLTLTFQLPESRYDYM